MNLSVLMTVYNERKFIPFAINSCVLNVDNLVIVEGAYQQVMNLGKPARSTDGTCEYIEKYIENAPSSSISQDKLHFIKANEFTDKDQRNVGLRKIKELKSDWLLIVDGDEVYKDESFLLIKNLCKNMEKNDQYACYFQSLTFVNDFNHYTFQKFPRLFRVTEKCDFVNDNYMIWPDKGIGWQHPHVIENLNIKYYHYGFVKGLEKFSDKKNWWMNRGLGKNFDYGWKVDEDGKIVDKNHTVYFFTGKHPRDIQNYFGAT